jgi:hypothetical protein
MSIENRLQNQTDFNGNTLYFMNASEDRVVRCFIQTYNFTATNQTNQTYQVNFTVSALNAPPVTQLVNVFVPFLAINETFEADFSRFFDLYNRFCAANPQALPCHPTPEVVNQTVIEKVPFTLNVTEEQVLQIQQLQTDKATLLQINEQKDQIISNQSDTISALVQQIQDLKAQNNYYFSQAVNFSNQSTQQFEILNTKRETTIALDWAIWILIIILLIVVFLYITHRRQNKWREK